MKKNRKTIFIALAAALICTAVLGGIMYRGNCTYSDNELLNMDKESLYELLLSNGLEVPEIFKENGTAAEFVHSKLPFVLRTLDEDIYNTSSPESVALTDSMRKTVKKIRKAK